MRTIPPAPRPESASVAAPAQNARPRPATVCMVILLGVLWVWVGLFLSFAEPPASVVGSMVRSRIATEMFLAALAIVCGYPLLRWWQEQQKSRR